MDENPQRKKERSGAEPIIVPIVLKMAEFDHEVWQSESFLICFSSLCIRIFLVIITKGILNNRRELCSRVLKSASVACDPKRYEVLDCEREI